ncbi:carboxypeptidase D, putative [Prunus dulcis]|uniref:Carboxypeptidase D, putative n=1 Tax=Prunus dulcis TaxID=3755 RepID=A0A4Y1RK90_PRUDU|nr:carboxypeptidase D, putative [Prunus dulcis]
MQGTKGSTYNGFSGEGRWSCTSFRLNGSASAPTCTIKSAERDPVPLHRAAKLLISSRMETRGFPQQNTLHACSPLPSGGV